MANWKNCEKYPGYQVSSDGQVFNIEAKAYLYQEVLSNGNLAVVLKDKGNMRVVRIDELVASAFVSNPNHYVAVAHKDGNSKNVAASNLEWAWSLKE